MRRKGKIGKGNDAVDCTIWSLTERNTIYREKYYFYSGIKTKDVKAAMYKLREPGDMEFRTPYNHLREINVMVGNGVKFDESNIVEICRGLTYGRRRRKK